MWQKMSHKGGLGEEESRAFREVKERSGQSGDGKIARQSTFES